MKGCIPYIMVATRSSLVRRLTVVVVVAFIGILGYYLVQPGVTWTRLVFFVVLGGLAVLATAGVFYQRGLITTGAASGLLLLGFWQAVLWIYILPLVVVFVIATFTDSKHGQSMVLDKQ